MRSRLFVQRNCIVNHSADTDKVYKIWKHWQNWQIYLHKTWHTPRHQAVDFVLACSSEDKGLVMRPPLADRLGMKILPDIRTGMVSCRARICDSARSERLSILFDTHILQT